MKKIFAAFLWLVASVAFGATLSPISLLNPAGSTSGQAIVSTGASSAPVWGGIGVNGIGAVAANTVLANATGSSASPTAFAMPGCSASASALGWTSGTGFTCNSSLISSGTTNPSLTYTSAGTGAIARNYQSKLGDVLSVKDFGATGNGSTNDTSAIVAAATYACSLSQPPKVYLPAGNYLVTTGNLVFCNGLHYWGDGQLATIISTASTTGNLFTNNNTTGTGIHSLAINYTGTPTGGYAIALTGSTFDLSLDNLRITNAFGGISCAAGGPPQIFSNIDIEGLQSGGTGLYVNGGSDIYVTNMLIYSPFTNPAAGIQIQATGGVWLENVDVVHNVRGLLVNPPNGSSVQYLFVMNSAFDTSSVHGIDIVPSSGGSVLGSTFIGNWSASATNVGFYFEGAGTINGARVVGHRSFNNGQDGLIISNGTNIGISDSDFSGNSQTTSNTSNGITVAAGVTNFQLTGNRSGPMAGFANTQASGIAIGAGASNNYVISDNNVTGNVTSGMTDGGTGTTKIIKGNLGYNPLTSSITVGASPFTWTNNTGDTATVIIAGGTVSAISMAGLAIGGTTNTSVAVPQGQSLVVTYSSVPTMVYKGY